MVPKNSSKPWFVGSISSVVPFGIFVALDDVFVEGLVHVSDLGRDYFHFDEKAHAMVGERTGARYRLSDSFLAREIDLAPIRVGGDELDDALAELRGDESLATRFAHQWLRLQDLTKVEPDAPPGGVTCSV